MKYTDLLPSLLNWPFVIMGVLLTGGSVYGILIGGPVLGYEFYRTRKIYTELNVQLTPDLIREYFAQDRARKYLPVNDQVNGIKTLVAEKAA